MHANISGKTLDKMFDRGPVRWKWNAVNKMHDLDYDKLFHIPESKLSKFVLRDGRTLDCSPADEILCTDGRWVRVDQLDQLAPDQHIALVPGGDSIYNLVLEDGRTLDCSPDDEIFCTGAGWVRVDQLDQLAPDQHIALVPKGESPS